MQCQIVLFAKHLTRGTHKDQTLIDQVIKCIHVAFKHRNA